MGWEIFWYLVRTKKQSFIMSETWEQRKFSKIAERLSESAISDYDNPCVEYEDEALAKSEASEATAKELQTDKEDLRKQIKGLNDQVEEYKKKEQDLAQINSDLQVKLKETESFAEQIASLNKDLQDHKHLVELKEIELKNCTDNFQTLKTEHDKVLKGLEDVRNELYTCKQEIGHLDSQLQAKAATLESVNSQLELERSRSEELQNKYFALAEAANRKAE